MPSAYIYMENAATGEPFTLGKLTLNQKNRESSLILRLSLKQNYGSPIRSITRLQTKPSRHSPGDSYGPIEGYRKFTIQ